MSRSVGQVGRGVVWSGIVSHPSRQQERWRKRVSDGRLPRAQQCRLSTASNATVHPVQDRVQGVGREPVARASCGGLLEW